MGERVYRTEAVILRRSEIGEADRLLTIMTPHGKRRVIAKGTRKVTSRLAGHIELFVHATLLLAVGRTFDIVTQSSPLERFETLSGSLERISAAYYVAELVDRTTGEEDADQDMFDLLVQTLRALDQTRNIDLVLRSYELHLLATLGYRPQLQQCARCQERLTEATDRYSLAAGGALCPRCAAHDSGAQAMALPTFKLLRYLQQQRPGDVERLTISDSTRQDVELLLRQAFRRILERDLKSLAFLDDVRSR